MVAKLNGLGLDLDWSRVQAIAGGATVCRPHLAQAMVERGHVATKRPPNKLGVTWPGIGLIRWSSILFRRYRHGKD